MRPKPEAPEDLTSRSDIKRANRVVEETLARLTQDLCTLSDKRLRTLGLSEELVDAVSAVRLIKSVPARHRQLRLVRGFLRNTDWPVIRERLSHLLEHGTLPADHPNAGAEATWLARLLGEGFAGLDAFMAAHPRADRARLQDLIRQVDRNSHERRVKSERKLADAIRGFLR
jgi:ribosome-associated protein